jgi:hypothetical protein
LLRSLMLGCRRLLPEAAAGVNLLALSSLSADELPLYRDPSKTTAERTEDLLARMAQAEKVGQLSQGVVRPGESDDSGLHRTL